MTNKVLKAAAAASVLAGAVFGAQAAHAASATATAKADVIGAITIQDGTDLDFGTIVATDAAQTKTVAATDAGASSFTVGGSTRKSSVSVNVDSSVTLYLDGDTTSGTTMTASLDQPTTVALTSGSGTLNVGGTLSIAANQADGVYSGTYTVTTNGY